MKFKVRVTLILLVVFAAGCTAPVYLKSDDLRQRGTGFATEAKQFARSCTVRVLGIEDRRWEKRTLGEIAGRTVRGENLAEWVAEGLKLLDQAGYRMVFGQAGEDRYGDSVDIHVEIKTAHVRSISTSMTATLVFAVTFSKDGVPLMKRTLRGVKTQVAWTAAESEINRLLYKALTEILAAMSEDLTALSRQSRGRGQMTR